jgi:cytochrome P450
MLIYPDVQAKAHEEVDRIVKQGRLPDFSDELPYVRALVKECLRWNPVIPLGMTNIPNATLCLQVSAGLPHRVTEDDVSLGYHIPKGSIVIGNAW